MANSHLVWLDLEMSGLDVERHVILEIAALVTDKDLKVIAEGPDLAIYQSPEALVSMDEWSVNHHGASGLLERVRSSSHDTRSAERQVLDFLSAHCPKGSSPLCGNSVWQDRRFLARFMPELEAYLHYRVIDVSSVKELVRRWYPDLPPFQKKKTHLALSDIKESIEELRYYRKNVFIAAIAG
jgi:oligoribonuclease